MSLKQIIKRQKILNPAIDAELVLPGEPMIYSIKYSVGTRTRSVQFFRNMKWKSLLKCFFHSYYKTNVPVVVIVRFYVSPPSSVTISPKLLKKESVPAVFSFELCDYLLSFLEMIHHVLINSYRQVVKLDSEKYYSSNPRTVFKFIKWENYVKLQNNNPLYTQTESVSQARQVRKLQSELQGNVNDEAVCKEGTGEESITESAEGTITSDSTFQTSSTVEYSEQEATHATPNATRKEARRRQSRKVPE